MPKSYDEVLNERLDWRRADERAIRMLAEERSAAEQLELPDLTLRDFVLETDEPVQWRIDGLHAVGHNTTLTASYKSGKSTLMINLLRSLADGCTFLGNGVIQPSGRIAYWNLEVADQQMRDWGRKVGITNGDRIVVANLRGRRTNLWSDAACESVVTWLKRNEIECWIVDPGARLLPGWPGSGNPENDNGVIGELCDRMDRIKQEAGVEDLWIPLHTGRAGQHSRGATRWDDWVDAIWRLKIQDMAGIDMRLFSATGRDVDFPEVVLGYDKNTHREWAEESLEAAQTTAEAKTVVRALRGQVMGLNSTDLRASMVGIGTDRKTAAITAAADRGWILRGKVGRGDVFRLNESNGDVREQLFDMPGAKDEVL